MESPVKLVETPEPRKKRLEIGHFESELQRNGARLAHTVDAPFFSPEEMAALPPGEVKALTAYFAETFRAAVEGRRNLPARPTIDAVMANWADEMYSRPVYYHWKESERELIRQKLIELDGELLLPGFAYSIGIREPSGRIRFWNRRGEVTKV